MVESLAVPKQAAMALKLGGGGALADGVDQLAAVGEEGADGVEEDLDVGGRSGGGGIGRGGGYGVWYW